MLGFFRPAPDAPPLQDPAAIDRLYRRWRWSVFLSIVVGYTIFYVTRLATTVKGPVIASGTLSVIEASTIDTVFLWTYAIGKTSNGFLADRASPRRFFATALLVSAAANLIFGLSSVFPIMLAIWALNAWALSCGVPISGVVMASWFSTRELGTRYAIWSIAHHAGEAISFVLSTQLVAAATAAGAGADAWRAAFIGPAIVGVLAAIILYRTLCDRPASKGLPPIAAHRSEPLSAARAGEAPLRELQLQVLRNPWIWVCGLASGLVYISRYAITNWGHVFLQEGCGYSVEDAGALLAVFPLVGIAGVLLAGPLSDRVTGGRRVPIAFGYGLLLVGSLAALYHAHPDAELQIVAGLAGAGFAMGGLLAFLGGLIAMELCSPRAAGTALGIVGGFSYLGAGLQSLLSGLLIERGRVGAVYDFSEVRWLWLGAPAAAVVLIALLWAPERRAKS